MLYFIFFLLTFVISLFFTLAARNVMRHFKIVDYSAEQRSEAMGVINDLASLFSNDSDDGLLRIFSDQPEKFSFDFDSSVNSNPLFSSDLLPDVAEFGLVTGNYHLKHEITKIINNMHVKLNQNKFKNFLNSVLFSIFNGESVTISLLLFIKII
jgi:hypothetical protein